MRLSAAFALSASLVFGLSTKAEAQDAPVSKQVQLAVDHMRETGETTIVVLDKKNGELLVVDNGEIVMKSPALFGKGVGEIAAVDYNVTEPGVYSMKKYAAPEYETGTVLSFDCRYKTCQSIHATWQGNPEERRNNRLATATAADNAISNGCINVPTPFYKKLDEYLSAKKTFRVTPTGAYLSYPRLVILPKDYEATYSVLGIPKPQSVTANNSTPTP